MAVTTKVMLFAAGLVMLAAGTASAAAVEVKVPFPFVVQGQTMPAGQYRVESETTDPSILLIRGEKGTKPGMFVVTRTAAGHDPAGDTPALTFDRFENTYRLVSVWESMRQGQEIPVSR
jgi:hypothetical protein